MDIETLAQALTNRMEALEDTLILLVNAVANSAFPQMNSPDVYRFKEAIRDARDAFEKQIKPD